ncbi:hypothetical protein GLOTRDRAFT_113190 [Gloeophyllum trabeum ATCC 11539]|uniref:Tethering factor for nuclear proteasome STS1 n=1 Tax=Gloeophyllum trabeum (strain ATCC 11539 / FP-39264 / Madison 617) TaxID=670483 RepID=S7QMA3_GLOTA|nr:uncharacterized protein GLOTRDRAFT_113190 [Gloeophyllum trabeum ATCC 11539]EPQ60593.1 hypothetical protein GLOTRDRAFT_113190 [Gloeophyllum trabeum ATCC 11539]
MAYVMPPHPHLDFHAGPVKQAPSPFGFGFGLGSSSSVMGMNRPNHSHGQVSAFQPAPAVVQPSPVRGSKRRHEAEDEENIQPRDESMDRSPTPERPKRAVPKRARMVQSADGGGKGEKPGKDSKGAASNDGNDMDVGVLLASLPPEALLPLLTSLITAQPSLKPVVLSLIPRPTLDTALHALAQAAKKLRDAYPFSHASSFSQGSSSTFSAGLGNSRHNISSSSHGSLGFGFSQPSTVFPSSSTSDSFSSGGMRDSYVLSRLRPHIDAFVTAASTYLPYFSFVAPGNQSASPPSSAPVSKDKLHPSEVFVFLSALTTHILEQPPLAQSSLAPLLLPRLSEEWKAWVLRVDDSVNRQGGMYREETVRTWERDLDAFAQAKDHGMDVMRDVRDRWVQKVGWLVGRMGQPMEEF